MCSCEGAVVTLLLIFKLYKQFWRGFYSTKVMFYQKLKRLRHLIVCVTIFCSGLHGDDSDQLRGSPDMLKDLGLKNDEAVQRGKQQMEKYRSESSPCWKKAVEDIESTCSELTDIDQSILAIKFANCHFEKSGLKTFECTNKSDFKRCTNEMKKEDSTAFMTYTTFFTHVTDVCFYLQSEIWRQKTAKTISRLSTTAESTVEKLDQSLQNQDLVLQSQNKSLSNQQKILQNEEQLKTTLENSTKSAKAAFEQMKQKADEQQAIFSNTFDGIFDGLNKLKELQTLLLGEFIGLQSFAFYVISILSCYFFTSSPRTIEARFYLFTLFALLIFVEKLIVDNAVKDLQLHVSQTVCDFIILQSM